MKNSNEHIDLIERYLYDDMTKEELEGLNKKLREDPEFNKLFHNMDNLLEGIRRSASKTTVEEKLAILERSLPEISHAKERKLETPIIPIWNFTLQYKTAIAASISLIIVTMVVLTNITTSKSPEKLYTEYFNIYENINGVERGKSDKEKLQYAMIAYEQANFEKAVKIFEQITITDENKIQIWLYNGNAYMALDRVNEAKENFQNIIDAKVGFESEARWYLSLCYLKENDVDQARVLLQEIQDSGRGRYQDAAEILSKLK
jgi:tetratricopeptide (TPR) repeat protein